MSKSQNRSMGNRTRQENMTPQKVNNHTMKDLMDSKRDKTKLKRMMIRMIKEVKKDMQKQIQESMNE
jgi:hypothetical protein